MAVELYRTLVEKLRKDLGAAPDFETRALFAEISRPADKRPSVAAEPMGRHGPHPAEPNSSEAHHAPVEDALTGGRSPALASKQRPRGRGWMVGAGMAVAAGAAILAYEFPSRTDAPNGVEAVKSALTSQASAIAVAVLPFANLSGNSSQDFFSDGITEEITTALARVPDLRVIARASASRFKGERDMRTVGQALGATHLIEGSVREDAGLLRITAQLIDANSGAIVWTERYERELPGVFAVQEEIATAIAERLMAPLGLAPGEQLVSSRSIDPASYQQFLRARAVMLRGRVGFAEALEMLEPLVARNPEYAPAWAKLAGGYGYAMAVTRNNSSEERRRTIATYLPKMEAAAKRAVEVDPNSADANVILATFYAVSRKFALADDVYSKALVLDPNHPDALEFYSSMLLSLGRVKEGLAMKQLLHELEPFVPYQNVNLAMALWIGGQERAAIAIDEDFAARPGAAAEIRDLAEMYASMGRYGEAADLLPRLPPRLYAPELAVDAAHLLRTAPAKAASPEKLPRLGMLGFIYLHVGAPERVLEFYEERAKDAFHSDPMGLALLWHPSYVAVRKTERFKAFARGFGFVDHWRARGWPDLCRPVGADDFACD